MRNYVEEQYQIAREQAGRQQVKPLDQQRYGSQLVIPTSIQSLAQSYLDRRDEDWTWVDPEDIKRLARAVLAPVAK